MSKVSANSFVVQALNETKLKLVNSTAVTSFAAMKG
jgi:hypothetical protein